jgi:hypothetical protein
MKVQRVTFPVTSVALLLLACHGGAAGKSDAGGGGGDGGGDDGRGAGATGWGSGTMISDARSFLDYELFAGAVDVNDSGVAVALWGENIIASRMNRLWGSVYRAGAWSAPTALGDPGSGDGSVSVMPNGDAMVVYVQSQHVQAKRYLAASDSWTSSAPISADAPADTFTSSPGVVTDGLGNAIAVWSQSNQVWARRYDASAGWSATVVQLSASPRSAFDPKIVVDGNHRFTAVWVEDTAPFDPSLPGGGPNKPTAHARRYVADWEPDRRIGWADTDLPGQFDSASRIWIDANSAGSVFVVWEQSRTLPDNSIQREIDAAHFDPVAGAWSPPETIASHNANLSFPQVAVDSSGRALAGWIRDETNGPGTHLVTMRGSWFNTASGTWGTAELLDQTGTGEVSDAALAVDGAGNAELAWDESGKGTIERRFSAGAWGAWNKLPPGADNLRIDMSDSGHAVLIGDRLDIGPIPFTREIWAWVYTP